MDLMISDAARRRLCRAGFFVLCLLPLGLVLRWSLFPATPSQWERALQDELGVLVHIEQVVPVSLQATRLVGVRLGSPGPNAPICLDEVQMERSATATTLRVNCGEAVAAPAWETLRQIVRRGAWIRRAGRPVRIEVQQLTMRPEPGGDADRLNCTGLQIDISGQRRQWTAAGLVEDESSPGNRAAQVKLAWFRPAAAGDSSRLEFNSGSAWLPGWLIGAAAPSARFLNPDCRLQGRVHLAWQPEQQAARFSGTCRDLDLDHVVGQRFGYTLAGRAEVVIDKAIVQDNLLTEFQGTLRSEEGTLGRAFQEQLVRYLSMEQVDGTGSDDAYRQLQIAFHLKRQHLQLRGLRTDGTVALDGNGLPHLVAAQGKLHSVSHLLATLAAPASPLSRPMLRLMQHLVLPASAPETANPQRSAQVPATVGENFFR